MSNVMLGLFYFFTLYAFLPGLFSRMFGYRVIKKGISDMHISLTFDDGPDPLYTPKLLDVLRKHGIKVTFFVVGKHAEAHPDIIRRMHAEGHSIGIHNYSHRTNWFMRPGTVARQVDRTSELIRRLTGEKPQYYRPPWGIINLFDYTSRNDLQIVLWSAMPGDWRTSAGAAKIYDRMRKQLKGGQIYLLHDCGRTFGADEDAPQHTIEALERFIPFAAEQGYSFVRVDELVQVTGRMVRKRVGWGRKALVAAWLLWERCFHAAFKLQSAETDVRRSFLHYRLTQYHGESIMLNDGETLQSGDRVAEIHMNNALLYEFGRKSRSSMQLAIQLVRGMERSMFPLAAALMARKDVSAIKAVLGTTMVNRGVEQFGFTVTDLPKGWFARLAGLYLKVLLTVIHPQGKKRLGERAEALVPKRIAISMREVARRYGAVAEEAKAGVSDASAADPRLA